MAPPNALPAGHRRRRRFRNWSSNSRETIQAGATHGCATRSAISATRSTAIPSSASFSTTVEPAPERSKRMPWKTFIRAHLGALAAMDFFNVEVFSLAGIVRYSVLFVIELKTRRVHIAGIARYVHGAWMKQVARNLTEGVDGFLQGMRYVIHDRDPLFTREFRDVLSASGTRSIRLPA